MNKKYKFDAISFGMRLCKIREFNGLTQEKAAEAVDVSVKSIQNWEHGDKMPGIDNMVALAELYHMTVGEILEDEAYRIFEKKADARKRSIEIIEIPNKLETFMEITEDRYFDRYEVWVWDEFASYKYMFMSIQKLIPYDELKTSMLNQVEDMVLEYRTWLFDVLTDSEEDQIIKEQIEKKIKCENAGMAARGAVCIDGVVHYFDV